jgi:NAD(P)-dependent dehydrogenase (short-subunit alcohol dehydrogenase family)
LGGEVALVTGSTSGLGREIARMFAAEGARVVVTGRDEERGRAVSDRIAAEAGADRVAFVAADLTEEAQCRALVGETVDRFGPLTVLVNNAVSSGGSRDGAVADMTTQGWDAIFRVNVTAAAWLARETVPLMIAAGHGSIVNISSRQAERASRGFAAYIASKGALNALTRSIAVDYAEAGVRCNTISPGYILNDRRDADMSDERRARMEGMHLTRLGTAADVAYAAVYLASAESGFLTGINLPLDGGSSAARGLVLG